MVGGECPPARAITALNHPTPRQTDLPLSFAISHLEQKACAVLCTLVSLGIKNIHLGPTAPAYLGPKMAQLLTEGLGLRICDAGHVENDLERFLGKTA